MCQIHAIPPKKKRKKQRMRKKCSLALQRMFANEQSVKNINKDNKEEIDSYFDEFSLNHSLAF